jgi:hypothetical protein
VSSRLRTFGDFCYDFVVGDDWRCAVAVVVALGLTYAVHRLAFPAWWMLPVAVLVVLPVSLWRGRSRDRE